MSDWLGANPTTTLVAWLTTNTNCPFPLGQTPANKGNFQGDIIGFAHQSTLSNSSCTNNQGMGNGKWGTDKAIYSMALDTQKKSKQKLAHKCDDKGK